MSTRHGNLTNAPLVFNQADRDSRLDHYGDSFTLGKSKRSTYSEVFINSNSPTKTPEQTVFSNFLAGRNSLVSTVGDSSNPDFDNGFFNYNYSGPLKLNKIQYKREEERFTEVTEGLNKNPHYTGQQENAEITSTDDSSGTFTPNLNVSFDPSLDSNESNSSFNAPLRSNASGGFGSDTTIGIQDDFRAGDIHTNATNGITSVSRQFSPTQVSDDGSEISGVQIARGNLGQYTNNRLTTYSSANPITDGT